MNWTLVLALHRHHSGSTSSIAMATTMISGFSTEESCIAAGKKAKRELETSFTVAYSCLEVK